MPTTTVSDGSKFAALLFFSLVVMLFDGFTEVRSFHKAECLAPAWVSLVLASCLTLPADHDSVFTVISHRPAEHEYSVQMAITIDMLSIFYKQR